MTGISSAPYYYTGPATGANLFTNTSVSVDSRLSYSQLYSLLSTPAVLQDIAHILSTSEQHDSQPWGRCLPLPPCPAGYPSASGTPCLSIGCLVALCAGFGTVEVLMIPYSNPNPSSGGGLSVGAIIGIAVGGGLAVVLIVTLLICWRRRSRTSKNASSGGGQGQFKSSGDAVMEAGVSGISDLPTMKQRPQAASGLLYGSAFSTGTAADSSDDRHTNGVKSASLPSSSSSSSTAAGHGSAPHPTPSSSSAAVPPINATVLAGVLASTDAQTPVRDSGASKPVAPVISTKFEPGSPNSTGYTPLLAAQSPRDGEDTAVSSADVAVAVSDSGGSSSSGSEPVSSNGGASGGASVWQTFTDDASSAVYYCT